MAPVVDFHPALCRLGQLTQLTLNLESRADLELPAGISNMRQLAELVLNSSWMVLAVVDLEGLSALPALHSLRVNEATLPDLEPVQARHAWSTCQPSDACKQHRHVRRCWPLPMQGLTTLTSLELRKCQQLVDEEQVARFTAADYSAALDQLPQLWRAFVDAPCQLRSWDAELPHMPHLTALCMWLSWGQVADEPPLAEGVLCSVLARLPSVRHLAFRGSCQQTLSSACEPTSHAWTSI